jgi:TonB family protein
VKSRFGAIGLALCAALACRDVSNDPGTEDPALLTTDLPFQYPPALFAERIEADVELRLFVDSLGLVVPESTTIAQASGRPEFDSAAVAGAPYLEFRPAREAGSRVGRAVVLPVKFRVPPDSQRRDTLPQSR